MSEREGLVRAILCAGVLAAGVSGAAVMAGAARAAQPEVQVKVVSPAEVLAKVQARYRAGPTCERVLVEVRTDSGRVGRSMLVVRMDPRREKPGEAGKAGGWDPVIALELGALRVRVGDGRLVAVHERNAETCYEAAMGVPLTVEALGRELPPLPLPQLDLLTCDPAGVMPALGWYARSVSWQNAAADARQPGRVTLMGVCDLGAITMTVRNDQVTGIEVRSGERGAGGVGAGPGLKLSLATASPCREEDLLLSVEGRRPVTRLAELQPKAGVLRAGAAVPEMQWTTAAGKLQPLREWFVPPAEFATVAARAERLVVVFARKADGGVDSGILARSLRSMQEASMLAASGREDRKVAGPPMTYVQVVVFEAAPGADELLGRLKAEREKAGWGDQLAWTTEPKSTVDLFATGGESAVVIVDGKQRLLSVIPITARTTTEQLVDQIGFALMEGE